MSIKIIFQICFSKITYFHVELGKNLNPSGESSLALIRMVSCYYICVLFNLYCCWPYFLHKRKYHSKNWFDRIQLSCSVKLLVLLNPSQLHQLPRVILLLMNAPDYAYSTHLKFDQSPSDSVWHRQRKKHLLMITTF